MLIVVSSFSSQFQSLVMKCLISGTWILHLRTASGCICFTACCSPENVRKNTGVLIIIRLLTFRTCLAWEAVGEDSSLR